jgi:2-dehydro-3-deoxyphosphogluconate aldolase/(4S)-4-hydroxy-2-oxoglutarate aldolase
MHKKEKAIQAILEQRLLPLYYHESAEVSINILKALYDAGIRVIEYTNRGENALENFKALRTAVDQQMPGMLLGIGTIKTRKQAKKYIEAKADFIVCPSMNEEVADITHDNDLLWIPGCMTPTEVAAAEDEGARLVKIFPGNVLGPSYISAIKELFPELKFMPTGGVEAEVGNLKSWFGSGVVAVGMGSKLITKELVSKGDYEGLKKAAQKAMLLVKEAGGGT